MVKAKDCPNGCGRLPRPCDQFHPCDCGFYHHLHVKGGTIADVKTTWASALALYAAGKVMTPEGGTRPLTDLAWKRHLSVFGATPGQRCPCENGAMIPQSDDLVCSHGCGFRCPKRVE